MALKQPGNKTIAEPQGYDAWFREQVEIGLQKANDPNTVWHTQKQVNERMAERRARKMPAELTRQVKVTHGQ